jgi:ParB-like chromosome segregation protein Spo0J
MLAVKDVAAFADDIAENGLREPIVLYEGKILDGRNRYKACTMAGVEPTFKDFGGSDPLAFVISANLHRRHLTDDQRAMVAAKIATMKQGARTDLSSNGGMSQADAAKALDVSKRKVEQVHKVRARGVPELVAAIERGEVSVSAAVVVAGLPVAEQKEILAKGAAAVVKAAKAKRPETKAEWRAYYAAQRKAQTAAAPAHDLKTPPSVAPLPPSAPAVPPLNTLVGLTANELAAWIDSATPREEYLKVWNVLARALKILQPKWADDARAVAMKNAKTSPTQPKPTQSGEAADGP